ncbi:hypothetical protein LINPERHAP2_LOCUS38027, partial [Linum perenne]
SSSTVILFHCREIINGTDLLSQSFPQNVPSYQILTSWHLSQIISK